MKDIPSLVQLQLASCVSFDKTTGSVVPRREKEVVKLYRDNQDHLIRRTLGHYAIVQNTATQEFSVVHMKDMVPPSDIQKGVASLLNDGFHTAKARRNR